MKLTSPVYFTLGGLVSHCPAWDITNILELEKQATYRGDPTIIPLANGSLFNPLRPTVTERTLNGQVWGRYDPDGNRYPDPFVGMRTNLKLLIAGWGVLPVSADSSRSLVYHWPGEATKAADVQVTDFDFTTDQMPAKSNLILRIRIEAGALA